VTDVGVRELKARLSEYVQRASRGEIIRVTDRGKPTAILAPIPGRARLGEGIAAGWVRAPAAGPRGPWRRFRASRALADLLAEDRGA
jgi:prevent-host-death family protein